MRGGSTHRIDPPAPRPQRRPAGTLALVAVAGAAALAAACADGGPTPMAPDGAMRGATAAGAASAIASAGSHVVTQRTVGDTTVTTFVLRPDGRRATLAIGNGHRVTLPAGAASICDPAHAGYGPATWDLPCAGLGGPITITARSWTTGSEGLPRVAFEPDVRFVPGHAVTLHLQARGAALRGGDAVIGYCATDGDACVDESLHDASVTTRREVTAGADVWHRRLKHFSGYTVLVNRKRRD